MRRLQKSCIFNPKYYRSLKNEMNLNKEIKRQLNFFKNIMIVRYVRLN